MQRNKAHRFYGALVLFLTLSFTTPARANEPSRKEQAVKLYREGMKAYKTGHFKEAIAKFDASHALHPHLNNIYYGAEAHRRLGDLRTSYERYSRYAAMLSEAQRADFQVKLNNLRWNRKCKLSVASQPGGAKVLVGGKVVAQTPNDGSPVTMMINGGEHEVSFVLEGHVSGSRKVQAEFGEPMALSMALQPLATKPKPKPELKPAPLPAPAPAPEPKPKPEPELETRPEPEQKPEPTDEPADEPEPGPEPEVSHPGDGVYADLFVGVAFPDYGNDNLELGAATSFGLHAGYLLRWGRIGLQLGAAVMTAPVSDKTDGTADDGASWFVTFLAGPGFRFYILDNLWAGASVYVGASTLHGASADSFFFKDTIIAEVTGSFTSFALRPELTAGWHAWRGLTLVLTAFAVDYSPAHGQFTDNISHILRYQVGAGLGWSF